MRDVSSAETAPPGGDWMAHGTVAGEGNGAQGRNRTTDTAIFSRMLYQLSYLGTAQRAAAARGHTGCPPSRSSRVGVIVEIAADLVQVRRRPGNAVLPGQPAARDRHRRSARCRTAASPRRTACRRPGSAAAVQRRAACARSWRLHGPGVVRPATGRCAGSRCARSAVQGPPAPRGPAPAPRTTAGAARSAGSGSGRRRRPRGDARNAARPAACGPASSSCSGGCTRGRTISASPSAVKPSKRGRSGIVRQRRRQRRAQRRRAVAPAGRRGRPGSPPTGCAGGSAAPAPAAGRGSAPAVRGLAARAGRRAGSRRRSPSAPASDGTTAVRRRAARPPVRPARRSAPSRSSSNAARDHGAARAPSAGRSWRDQRGVVQPSTGASG